jgi:hypothetical protein
MIIKKIPFWVKTGILIFPVLLLTSVIAVALKTNILWWMIVPSVVFEEIFESFSTAISDSILLNLLFILVFWFAIGSLIGLFSKRYIFKRN